MISKSEYILFLKHPAWLWLKKHDETKLPQVDDNTQAIFNSGNLFEIYANKLFPEGLMIGFDSHDEYLTLPQRTKVAIDGGNKVLFQARFEYEDITCICDIVEFVDERTVNLFEVKSSTKAKPEHEYDLAFQMVVLEACGYTVQDIAIIHVNNSYVRNGPVNYQELTATANITEAVKARREFTKENIRLALTMLENGEHPDFSPTLAGLDAFSDWLAIYKHLFELSATSIYNLCQLDTNTLAELEAQGIEHIEDIPENFKLKPKQALQADAIRTSTPTIYADKIKDFLSGFEFPLYFFDYETMAGIVPYFDGMRPYQQIPFQYSLHILDAPAMELRHVEYLHRENSNPAEPLSTRLKSQIGTTGSVITWNMSFEKMCNTTLGKLLPDYEQFYNDLNERIVDLMIPFSKNLYVHKDFEGSASIKHIMPVLVPELSYKVLGIQEGGSAQRLWMEAILDGKRDDEKEKILSDLVEYCKLDTFAMVRIYEELTKL